MRIDFIPIHKDDSFDVKIEIYNQTLGVITKNQLKYLVLQIIVGPDITVFEKVIVESMLMICADRNICKYQSIINDINVDYKEQVIIAIIKLGI